eukprot:TRINITY_DN1932_c0_g1_i1.p1 TRINITY_DN1932_c0_g1~~TRINITY_DN1932_c0_g1_i1.p1  ORF type:complete len:4003 (-),score=421.76 TRINITY_DN1932_c0_g1_i1:2311-14319(-)
MLEGIVSDGLVRLLGSYVDGLNRESIRLGVWQGDLELKNLRLRPDALAVLFESLGLDLPVTVTAGYIGLLRLEVPWKRLRSAPVRIFMHDVTVVASPVSDGDQSALELRDKRLKAARLATDEAIRDAKFSVRSMTVDRAKDSNTSRGESQELTSETQSIAPKSGYRLTRWGWRFTSKFVTKIVDNIQIDVENVVVQYEDASSVRDRPYTATLALDSLRACSTNSKWLPVFIESPDSPVVHKVVYMKGLVLNWEPGNAINDLKRWILNKEVDSEGQDWIGFVQRASRHAIRPMDGELKIALTKSSALASALAGTDDSLKELKNVPRVQLDLHFPDVKIALDDFQYHTLLSTIMYLSDIDRKVRPKTARGRWFWALERLLPRFKERREAALRFSAEGMRSFRETREEYCRVRNAVVTARRNGTPEPIVEAERLHELEVALPHKDIVLFRDVADTELYASLREVDNQATRTSRFWSFFSRRNQVVEPSSVASAGDPHLEASSHGNSQAPGIEDDNRTGDQEATDPPVSEPGPSAISGNEVQAIPLRTGFEITEDPSQSISSTLTYQNFDADENVVPNFRMGFLLGTGCIQLKQGGYPRAPVPFSNLEFRELRLGIETRPGAGLLLEALLGTFEVVDLQKNMRMMYPRVPWAGNFNSTKSERRSGNNSSEDPISNIEVVIKQSKTGEVESETTVSATTMSDPNSLCAVLSSYPHEISDAIFAIRGEYGLGLNTQLTDPDGFSQRPQYSPSFSEEATRERSSLNENGPQHPHRNREEHFQMRQTPVKYIAALRLNQEEVLEGDWAQGSTRMAMDLAIGGMEVLLDGPQGAFISSVMFWHPREKMPSIMQFLAKSAAPRLASLRMDIQKAILERSVPMRMDILIRGPRFVMPAPQGTKVSLVLDLGTFAMETSTGPSENIVVENAEDEGFPRDDNSPPKSISVRYTDYRMACTDLGLYIMPWTGTRGTERVITPFSVHLLLQVMHNSSFVDAVTVSLGPLNAAKVKLQGELPSLKISVSHDGFRNILKVVKGWGSDSNNSLPASGIEPNRAEHSLTIPSELEEIRQSHNIDSQELTLRENRSRLISFSMNLDFEDLQLELRDSMARRIVTISSSGTQIMLVKRAEVDDFLFRVHTFTVIDGSRGATAPFRRIAYAGVNEVDHGSTQAIEDIQEDVLTSSDSQAFISLSYRADVVRHEQSLAVRILSLHLVCVRETYFALADFFYLNESQAQERNLEDLPPDDNQVTTGLRVSGESLPHIYEEGNEHTVEDGEGNSYSDPFAALGMTTSEAARAFRDQAGRGMEISKQAFANRGQLSVNAELDGLVLTLVTAEGAIACFDVSDCKTDLTQYANGAVNASGELGGFGIRDLTSAFDVYSETIRYDRSSASLLQNSNSKPDGWSLRVPESNKEDIWLEARLRNIRIVYLHRFIVILKKYFDVLRESLKPVLEMKGGIAEMFDEEVGEDFPVTPSSDGRVRIRVITEDIDLVMPRHSQSPYEALRFFVAQSSITNDDPSAPGYQIGFEIKAKGVNAHVLYQPPAEGEGRALTQGGTEPVLKQISPNSPISDLLSFSENIWIVAKLDTWRRRRVPEVILNAEGIPVLKDGQEEREYDPGRWLPSIRVRISAPNGIRARLCEAEYSILYFTFTENIIERPDIEFTDIVRGLKTPVLPTRKPVQPIMFSSNRMPPNYQILFEVPLIESVIMSGADGRDNSSRLIRTELRDLVGSFEYGVDYRMTIDVSANMHSLQDARPYSNTNGMTLIMPTHEISQTHMKPSHAEKSLENESISPMARSVTLTWDRPFGFRANVMVVASHLRIIVDPELFRDLGALTAPGFPFLKSSAPPPLLRFNGRLLIVTISKPEIWLMANQYPGDGRSLVIRGDVIAKVLWAPVTGRNTVEVAAHGVRINLSSLGPLAKPLLQGSSSSQIVGSLSTADRKEIETPMLYPCDVSMKFEGRGYDPPQNPGDEPRKAPGSSLSVNAESFLVRIDVNDASLILAVGSRLVRLKPSKLSQRPEQPGRFDQWIDKGDEGDAKLSVHFSLPHCRLMFTDETLGRYVPIMEARLRNGILRSNVPWLTNAALDFALHLFNEEKGWWEPGIESFPIEFASSKGRSGSLAIHVRAERNIDVNITPNTVSGAARVSKALKSAVEDLRARLKLEDENIHVTKTHFSGPPLHSSQSTNSGSRRPSVAAFCVRNETGRSMQMWLPYDSKRRALRGNGGEVEVDTPTEEILWTALGATGGLSQGPSMNRQLPMSCILSLSGYEALTLSTEQTGVRLVKLIPDTRDMASPATGPRSLPSVLTLIWAVTMRDGVPYGCIRSAVRIVNQTRRLLEVHIGGMRKSKSDGNNVALSHPPGHQELVRDCHRRIKPGEAWAIPIYAINRMIRIRPYLLHALEQESSTTDGKWDDAQVPNSRLRYEFLWSDPLSNLSSLYEMAKEMLSTKTSGGASADSVRSLASSIPLLKCEGVGSKRVFCLAVHPVVDGAILDQNKAKDGIFGSIDIQLCTPLVIENLLPRAVFLKLATPGDSRRIGVNQIIDGKHIDPLAEAHIHGVGFDQSSLAAALGMDNSLDRKSRSMPKNVPVLPSRQTGDFHPNFLSLKAISTGSGRYMPFKVLIEHDETAFSRRLRLYCQYWIRNRSDTDLFFRDRSQVRGSSMANPKVFLRGCPPGRVADKYVCFSGSWISFQRADATEDIWVPLSTEIAEVDKPVPINLEGLSLVVDVRPAMGKFQRTLVVTIRNSTWLQNRAGTVLQWCQPEALNPHGIALASKVHFIGAGDHTAIHWDFKSQKKSLCLRRANEDSSSDWMWSRPVFVEGVQGEFPTKMYRPKRHEQYIARVVISKLGNGVSAIVVNREDRNTPPYRIVNHCVSKSIAFRQSGVNETRLWLVRPGRSTRYAWDDPQAPVKRRSLVVEVIETPKSDGIQLGNKSASRQSLGIQTALGDDDIDPGQSSDRKKPREVRYPKFDLNIDMIRAEVPFTKGKRHVPELKVSVHVEGPTKVVTFSDQSIPDDSSKSLDGKDLEKHEKDWQRSGNVNPGGKVSGTNLDIEVFVKAIGISFVDALPTELAYLSVSGVHFRLDRFDGQQLIVCDIQNLQLDNQLEQCTWPVVLWSPPPPESRSSSSRDNTGSSQSAKAVQKPFFQFTVNGPYPPKSRIIGTFSGIFVALQHIELAADEDFVLRVWLFVTSLIEAVGGASKKSEPLYGHDGLEAGIPFFSKSTVYESNGTNSENENDYLSRIYVDHLELCPVKLSVSFTSSRTSSVAEQIGGFRSLMRTLVAVLGNVENAEFRFNALELRQVCDTTAHFRSLIAEYYISQGSNQKMVLLASNSLIGNPSALFDSIAIGTRDFFVEPANAKGSADFIASIGRGSSSLLTNTVGGLVGSLGEIPRAVAQGLETAVGDRDYLAERDSIRGGRARVASSPAQGLFTGALSFGHGIASGAAGLIKDPIQGAAEAGPSGFIKGLGKGFIGGVLKPITGALDLIAEPAAGFRNMMVSERSHKAAEPVRPPRAFSGPQGDRMISYNLRSALGQAILRAVNRNENSSTEENLKAWTYLVAVHHSATSDDVVLFLWHLLRRSTRSTHNAKYLMDAEGNPQKAEKLRASLITSKRLIITSLDGHILWEHPLIDIIDFHVSLDASDYLMVGVRPAGTKTVVAPTWKRLRCGSMAARDELNGLLRKAMVELRAETDFMLRHQKIPGGSNRDGTALREIRREHRRDKSVEMVDMSFIESEGENMQELKRIHHDASNDGRRGVFGDMKVPGRSSDSSGGVKSDDDKTILKFVNNAMIAVPSRRPTVARSIRMIIANYSYASLRLMSASLHSGQWVEEPSKAVLARSVSQLEVDGTTNRVADISGRIEYQVGNKEDSCIAIRFLNPLLAPNAYSFECPSGFTMTQNGGERGDNVTTIINIRNCEKIDKRQREMGPNRSISSPAEPLLFGRSKVSPHLPPITYTPPHAASNTRPNPNDPSKIAQLASLGFSEIEAKAALEENEANLSKAYSALVDRRNVA